MGSRALGARWGVHMRQPVEMNAWKFFAGTHCCAWAMALLSCSLAWGAEGPAAKPMQQWGVAEVLAGAEHLGGELVDDADRAVLAQRAASLLLDVGLEEIGEYATIRRLVETATPAFGSLSDEQRKRLEGLLTVSEGSEDAATFDQLQARVALLNGLDKHDEIAVGAVGKWLGSRDLSSLGVEQVAWCLQESLPRRSGVKAFSVVWTGTLTPPRSGKYEFSTTPININRAGQDYVKHSLVVHVGSVEVLRTPQEPPSTAGAGDVRGGSRLPVEWQPIGIAVDLMANQAVPIRVEMRYEAARPSAAAPPSAILCWKGPGLERQAIAPRTLTGPQGEPDGLRAEYRWGVNQQEQAADEDVAVADVVWLTPESIAPRNPKLVQRLSDRLWSLATSEEYLQQCAAAEARHVYIQSPQAAGLLSSVQRQQFLSTIAARPEFLESMTAEQLQRLFSMFRFGAEPASIDLVGGWSDVHSNEVSVLQTTPSSVGFFARNYDAYARLGQCLAWQSPAELQQLQDEWVEDDDGRCRLPVAKILGFGFAARGELRSWIVLLDEKLADDVVAGDARVTWLLARSHAEELARSGNSLISRGKLQLDAGRPWLDEAELIAESDEVQRRVVAEQVCRLAGLGKWDAARNKLAQHAHDPSLWEVGLKRLEAASRAQVIHQQLRRHQLRLAELRRRERAARTQGNSLDAEKYAERISAAEAGIGGINEN